MSKHQLWELQSMQAAPLSVKILLTKDRIREWVNEYGEDGVYVSFSGGKDSTVLLTIARDMYPNLQAVFYDTSMEYPEIRDFVRTFDNVEWIKPKMNFKQVCQKYGYPIISKEVSEAVYGARKYLTRIIEQASLEQTDRQTDRQTRLTPNSSGNSRQQGSIQNRIRETHGNWVVRALEIAEQRNLSRERERRDFGGGRMLGKLTGTLTNSDHIVPKLYSDRQSKSPDNVGTAEGERQGDDGDGF